MSWSEVYTGERSFIRETQFRVYLSHSLTTSDDSSVHPMDMEEDNISLTSSSNGTPLINNNDSYEQAKRVKDWIFCGYRHFYFLLDEEEITHVDHRNETTLDRYELMNKIIQSQLKSRYEYFITLELTGAVACEQLCNLIQKLTGSVKRPIKKDKVKEKEKEGRNNDGSLSLTPSLSPNPSKSTLIISNPLNRNHTTNNSISLRSNASSPSNSPNKPVLSSSPSLTQSSNSPSRVNSHHHMSRIPTSTNQSMLSKSLHIREQDKIDEDLEYQSQTVLSSTKISNGGGSGSGNSNSNSNRLGISQGLPNVMILSFPEDIDVTNLDEMENMLSIIKEMIEIFELNEISDIYLGLKGITCTNTLEKILQCNKGQYIRIIHMGEMIPPNYMLRFIHFCHSKKLNIYGSFSNEILSSCQVESYHTLARKYSKTIEMLIVRIALTYGIMCGISSDYNTMELLTNLSRLTHPLMYRLQIYSPTNIFHFKISNDDIEMLSSLSEMIESEGDESLKRYLLQSPPLMEQFYHLTTSSISNSSNGNIRGSNNKLN